MNKLTQFFKDEQGASGVEYGILVAAIAAIIIVTVKSVGTKVLAAFTTVDTNM
jgi:pilus assembly protein Flp/PilA